MNICACTMSAVALTRRAVVTTLGRSGDNEASGVGFTPSYRSKRNSQNAVRLTSPVSLCALMQ